MPTVFNEKGYRFFFFSNDDIEPKHIHIEKDNKYVKFWLEPVQLAKNTKFNAYELSEIRRIVFQKQDLIKEKLDEYFD